MTCFLFLTIVQLKLKIFSVTIRSQRFCLLVWSWNFVSVLLTFCFWWRYQRSWHYFLTEFVQGFFMVLDFACVFIHTNCFWDPKTFHQTSALLSISYLGLKSLLCVMLTISCPCNRVFFSKNREVASTNG